MDRVPVFLVRTNASYLPRRDEVLKFLKPLLGDKQEALQESIKLESLQSSALTVIAAELLRDARATFACRPAVTLPGCRSIYQDVSQCLLGALFTTWISECDAIAQNALYAWSRSLWLACHCLSYGVLDLETSVMLVLGLERI